MAVDFVGSIQVYQGLTADPKPLGDVVPVGSTFQETDGDRRTWIKIMPGQGEEWVLLTPRTTPTNEAASLSNQREIIRLLKRVLSD